MLYSDYRDHSQQGVNVNPLYVTLQSSLCQLCAFKQTAAALHDVSLRECMLSSVIQGESGQYSNATCMSILSLLACHITAHNSHAAVVQKVCTCSAIDKAVIKSKPQQRSSHSMKSHSMPFVVNIWTASQQHRHEGVGSDTQHLLFFCMPNVGFEHPQTLDMVAQLYSAHSTFLTLSLVSF